MDSKNRSATCKQCGVEFSYEVVIIRGMEMMPRRACDACCVLMEQAAAEAEAQTARKEREDKWNAICPPIYRDTDPARINGRLVDAALAWNPCGYSGLGFIGTTGAGKTRAQFLALRRAFDAGKWCKAISHNAFSRMVQTSFSGDGKFRIEATENLQSLHRCDVLALDDLGKSPSTERADAELEELVEVRTSQQRPILWTANGSSVWLQARLGPDRGEPLVRRLSEFSAIVSL